MKDKLTDDTRIHQEIIVYDPIIFQIPGMNQEELHDFLIRNYDRCVMLNFNFEMLKELKQEIFEKSHTLN